MSSLRRRFAVRTYRISYEIPIFGLLLCAAWEIANGSRPVDIYLRDFTPRQRRRIRDVMRMCGFNDSFDSRRVLH